MRAHAGRIRRVVAVVFRNPELRRAQIAFAAFLEVLTGHPVAMATATEIAAELS